MLYPAFVELGDETHAYGVVLPDFPGCFSAADEAKDLPAMVQEAVEVHLQGMDGELPEPSRIEDLRHLPDYDYDGVWMLFDIAHFQPRPPLQCHPAGKPAGSN